MFAQTCTTQKRSPRFTRCPSAPAGGVRYPRWSGGTKIPRPLAGSKLPRPVGIGRI